ncbi:hypothetical protein HPP92_009272 [Vanilla planifolia]|uniref:Uncharacterized protein n=1 Tax=Vanilla planifolia TaxID=51239 RepID=A0A835V6H2_VANPL|nr:hypothetical protein HPP92_009473 [Vanilla planifolia]KAG0487177.1 hypothetical protein HPP92_009272 [Vanilla planifolia]
MVVYPGVSPCVVLFPLLCSTGLLIQRSSRLQGSLLENYDVDKVTIHITHLVNTNKDGDMVKLHVRDLRYDGWRE